MLLRFMEWGVAGVIHYMGPYRTYYLTQNGIRRASQPWSPQEGRSPFQGSGTRVLPSS